jgi:hypothetical protein
MNLGFKVAEGARWLVGVGGGREGQGIGTSSQRNLKGTTCTARDETR